MKLLKLGLRFWITLGSITSFLFGWAVLSHSLKPIQPEIFAAPTLAPLPPFGVQDNQQSQPFFSAFRSSPRFVSRGS